MAELQDFSSCADHSWLRALQADPETDKHVPNRTSRQVRSGHYVKVKPTPLPKPKLVAYSSPMAEELRLSKLVTSEAFLRFFSGDIDAIQGFESWATPYALSIYGQEMYDNCPFKNGNGYGDGRALSIGEVVVGGHRWEMQLKGGGRTPFCRGADGRAVLRSSVREFLASEAMHALGVSTTRALSLIVSQEETVDRPWYDQSKKRPVVNEAFLAQVAPQLADAPPELKQMAIAQLRSQLRNPDRLQTEQCAICCRVAPSFLRVGHIELHGRRARAAPEAARQPLELIVKHALAREYSDVDDPTGDLEQRILRMIQEFGKRLSKLMADWLRVGYCQGNFNSDNCLIAGRTMDYGPFGFIEKYDPLWNMWVGGGEHFAFMNQPKAARQNFVSFVKAVLPLLSDEGIRKAQEYVDGFEDLCQKTCDEQCWRPKLGLQGDVEVRELFTELEELMSESSIDYTIFWRQLSTLPENTDGLQPALYSIQPAEREQRWVKWLQRWRSFDPDPEIMRRSSPKYVPREWMLVEAYEAAQKGDFSVVHELQNLFASPFSEHAESAPKYFRKAAAETESLGGVAFMS